MIIETHVHLSDSKYDADRDEMIARAEKAGVAAFINIGAEAAETRQVAAYDRPGVYKALGLHPHNAHEYGPAFRAELENWLRTGMNIAAIGEIGLDFFRSAAPRDVQEKIFRELLGLAKEAELPVVIHSREAHEDTLKILMEFNPVKKGVIHCFSSDADAGKRFIDEGYMLGIGGIVTFQNAKELRQAVARLPLEFMVLETDAPWLAPQAVRGGRNEPSYLKYIVDAVAGIKGVTAAEVERITSDNARRMFGMENLEA